jgi:gliding motility-associated-like protein
MRNNQAYIFFLLIKLLRQKAIQQKIALFRSFFGLFFVRSSTTNSEISLNRSKNASFLCLSTSVATILLLFAGGCLQNLSAQDCNNPIQLSDITVLNTDCGQSSGSIFVSIANPSGGYQFNWVPNVSNTAVAQGLPAGLYHLQIVRSNNPNCFLDTTIIVGNSNGPSFQAYPNQAANCLAANGSAICVALTTLNYVWSNGAIGPNNPNLLSGLYTVTATNPTTGCSNIRQVVVQNENPLSLTAQVLTPAKCDRNTGSAQATVGGGSGQYSYNLGTNSLLTGLPSGTNFLTVTDNQTGCEVTTSFDIQAVEISGDINLNVHNVSCAGRTDGKVNVGVIPGNHFKQPFNYSIVDISGFLANPNALGVGKYYVYVFDADSCRLPKDSFVIQEPPPLQVQSTIVPYSCDAGGQILLQVTGGVGPIQANWDDLLGTIDPLNRIALTPGYYSGVVYDSLLCPFDLGTLKVPTICNRKNVVHRILRVLTNETYCVEIPLGLQPNQVVVSLATGSITGNSSYGSWVMANGCLTYSASNTPGFALDTVEVLRTAADLGLKDTICYVISITAGQVTNQTVFFSLQPQTTAQACGVLPPNFSNPNVVQLNRPGLSGNSGSYGTYAVHPNTACLTFSAAQTPGNNVDEIIVGVYDVNIQAGRIITYIPSISAPEDCSQILQLPAEYQAITQECDLPGRVCIPIPFANISAYSILDNGVSYSGNPLGCDFENVLMYITNAFQNGGPYVVNEWAINGQIYTGNFTNLEGLLTWMNQIDPVPGWRLQDPNFIFGGDLAKVYGPLKISPTQGTPFNFMPSQQTVALGTDLPFTQGIHQVVLRNIKNGCLDTVQVRVECLDCPPIHNEPLANNGSVIWETYRCAADTVFCTTIPIGELNQYNILKEGLPFGNTINCGGFVGLRFGVGLHHFKFNNVLSTCAYELTVDLSCENIPVALTDTIVISVGQDRIYCLDTTLLDGAITALTRVCPDQGYADWSVLPNWCIQFTGEATGLDQFCFQLCDVTGKCVIIQVLVQVTPKASSTLIANDDNQFGLKDTNVSVNILANDIINGIAGNIGGLTNLELLTAPLFGTVDFEASSGQLVYVPDAGRCGVDSFSYRITDTLGQSDEAWVKITVSCSKILIFNGISPNGDGLNDTWKILGIEQFPNNRVQVFNRWGNLVFEQEAYSEATFWDGRWSGRDLPDGTYFYILDLGDGSATQKGFIELLR